MKNGKYNEIEEILEKRFKGVKEDIKDPGFVKIEYREKEQRESFFKRPAVYAAGLALVAVLVCGGTFIGLKTLERIGANNIASTVTEPDSESGETTDESLESKGCYPVYLKIECGGKTGYPQSYMRWEGVNDGEKENVTYVSPHDIEFSDLDNVIVFETAVTNVRWYYALEDGMEATVRCRLGCEDGLFEMDDIQSVLGVRARGQTYRFIAVVDFKSVSDGVRREGRYEYPFDIYYIDDSESSGYLSEPVTNTETVTDDDCGTDKLRAPVYMTVKSGGETIYPNAYFLWSEKYSDGDGAWIDADGAGAETVKAVPDIAFDGVSLEIGYENASEVHYSIK